MVPTRILHNRRSEQGSAIIIVMMFVLVFMGMGIALFSLLQSNTRSTQLERQEVKSFNVAEAGVDAGMAALKYSWPNASGMSATVDPATIRAQFSTTDFRNGSHPGAGPFDTVTIYDNTSGNPLTDGATPVLWDANGDGRMWVDSRADVDDDRHRVLILAERTNMPFDIPWVAMFASTAGANGQGLDVGFESGPLPPNQTAVGAFYNGTFGKGVNAIPPVLANPASPGTFSDYASVGLMGLLKSMAQAKGTYFSDTLASPNAATDASAFLQTPASAGSIVYIETSTTNTLTISGNNQIGSVTKPVILVIKGPGLQVDWRGTADFYGLLIADCDAMNRGSSTFHGEVLASGTLTGKGNGSTDILYNGAVLQTLAGQYTVAVNIVPNTWEETKP
ncbi:MAG: hypothetical protein M1337_04165 [Actinobacteria bacterium]|nr:hypothetical protein [Actinomycetota bacterium]